MRQTSPSPAARYDAIQRRARLVWFPVLVGAPLAMAGAMMMALSADGLEPTEPVVASSLVYPAFVGACILFLLGARGIAGFILQPERLLKLNLTESRQAQPDTPDGEAFLRVQAGIFVLLAILDLPMVGALALGFLNWDIQLLLLAAVYGALVSVVAMPDFKRIAMATEQAIQRRDGNS